MGKQTGSKARGDHSNKTSRTTGSRTSVESARTTSKAAGRPGGTRSSTSQSKRVMHPSAVPLGGGTEPTEEQVRARAYEIYLARGRCDGDECADWLQAERELREELTRA
jgi:hypothetical protein